MNGAHEQLDRDYRNSIRQLSTSAQSLSLLLLLPIPHLSHWKIPYNSPLLWSQVFPRQFLLITWLLPIRITVYGGGPLRLHKEALSFRVPSGEARYKWAQIGMISLPYVSDNIHRYPDSKLHHRICSQARHRGSHCRLLSSTCWPYVQAVCLTWTYRQVRSST